MRFYTPTTLSEHISETPEGFLVCHGVAIARVGEMEYAPGEVPVEPGEDGLVRIERTEEAVFEPAAMASFEGKAVTINHPGEDVTPVTWKGLAVGHAQNIRRGEGEEADLLLADLVVTDEQAIALVRGGLREVSCGYDAPYEQIVPGRGRQTRIRGNHIALVHRGRCGSRCRINDQDKETPMSIGDKLLKALRRSEVRRALDEAAEPDVPEKDKPAPQGQEKAKDAAPARDAAMIATVDDDVVRRSGLLAPALPVRNTDSRCNVQRVALRTAMTGDAAMTKVVDAALNGATLDGCDCVTLDAAFATASDVAAARNNAVTADSLTRTTTTRDFGKAVTPADINAANAAHYGKKEE